MRAVLDTNVLLSGLLWHGAPHALIEQFRAGTLSLVMSADLIAELARTIGRAKIQTVLARSGIDPQQILAELRRLAEIVEPALLPVPVSRDPRDDGVLALGSTTTVTPFDPVYAVFPPNVSSNFAMLFQAFCMSCVETPRVFNSC